MKLTGFYDASFFRPSSKDYGEISILTCDLREIQFPSADRTQLHGYLLKAMPPPNQTLPLPAASGPVDGGAEAISGVDPEQNNLPRFQPKGTVVHFHGSDRNISFTAKNVAWLTEHGWNVLVFDYRGYGESEGKPDRDGVLADGIAAIEFACSDAELASRPIVLWGQSMGGQLAINAAAISKNERVQCVISEATYSSFSHHVKDKLAGMGPLWLIQWTGWLFTSDSGRALDQVGELEVPLLLVHGSADKAVAPYHSDWLLEAATGKKDIWRSQGGTHLRVFSTDKNKKLLLDYLEKIATAPDLPSNNQPDNSSPSGNATNE